jgi:hypothetical protein
MDEQVPVRRAAIGCLLVAVAVVALAIFLRPAIFNVALPANDAAVIVATASEVTDGPIRREIVLSRSHGWSGERDAGDGRVQVAVMLAPSTTFRGVSAVNATSPGSSECPIEIAGDRLTDCDGRAWTFEGVPIDPADPPLERFGAEIVSGSIVVDMTRPDDEE